MNKTHVRHWQTTIYMYMYVLKIVSGISWKRLQRARIIIVLCCKRSWQYGFYKILVLNWSDNTCTLIHVYPTLSFQPVKVGLLMILLSLRAHFTRLHSKSTLHVTRPISKVYLGEECSEKGPIFNLDNCLPLNKILVHLTAIYSARPWCNKWPSWFSWIGESLKAGPA